MLCNSLAVMNLLRKCYDMIALLTYSLAKPIITMRSISKLITCPLGHSRYRVAAFLLQANFTEGALHIFFVKYCRLSIFLKVDENLFDKCLGFRISLSL